MICKLMFFMKVSESFGTMIQLVDATLVRIYGFLGFFLFAIAIQCSLSRVIGYDIDDNS